MEKLTATAAARSFADMLDAVDARGESFTIMRRGRPVAVVSPPTSGRSTSALLEWLDRNRPDADWADDLVALRGTLPAPDSVWPD
jgi:antitoxin (DNA-binding transcriptional repressor) of toxin-antitoxin stability system